MCELLGTDVDILELDVEVSHPPTPPPPRFLLLT